LEIGIIEIRFLRIENLAKNWKDNLKYSECGKGTESTKSAWIEVEKAEKHASSGFFRSEIRRGNALEKKKIYLFR
jgi:hypothetical protein